MPDKALTESDYEIAVELIGTKADDLALQEVRFSAPPISRNKKIDLTGTRFFIVFRPAQESRLDENALYVKRSFPNYFFHVDKKSPAGSCVVYEMTDEFFSHLDRITVADVAAARQLITSVAQKASVLECSIKNAKEQIENANNRIIEARLEYSQARVKLYAAAGQSGS